VVQSNVTRQAPASASVEQIQAIPRTRFAPVERKHAVALLKAEGKSNREIAKELGVAPATVDRDVSAACLK
jgi:DNA-binding NarL/FixJ family response regulator